MRMRSGAAFWAFVLIVLGAIFLLQNMGILRVGWGVIWPVLLIAFGAFMLLGSFVGRGRTDGARPQYVRWRVSSVRPARRGSARRAAAAGARMVVLDVAVELVGNR